jgi:hypothetical protein
MEKDSSSIIVSIFKRKGAEGEYTKIISGRNQAHYSQYLPPLNKDEKGLIICLINAKNWLLLTSDRVLANIDGIVNDIPHKKIVNIAPALLEELNDGIFQKDSFTRLKLREHNGNEHILFLEKGKPYIGFYQALHFIMTKNK